MKWDEHIMNEYVKALLIFGALGIFIAIIQVKYF